MQAIWKDTTSYSAGQRGKKDPTSWTAGEWPNEIHVHRAFQLEGWFVSCHPLKIDTRQLESADLDSAKREAVRIVAKVARQQCKAFEAIERAAVKP